MQLELKQLSSIQLDRTELPDDPQCCAVAMCADIGIRGAPGADNFSFTLVTPRWLVDHPQVRWGRGYLLLPEFSWHEAERMVARLVSRISADSWEAAASALGKYLDWEFDGYADAGRH